MKRLLLSLLTIGTIGGSALGLSTAFFSDTESSTGNVLGAGAIDLQIDNTSYYNHAVSSETTWTQKDLTIEKFFNFSDVKPGDEGEDTISVHVNTNDSWLCAEVKLTSDDENGINPVESIAGDVSDGTGSGELADRINFLWWADDGDNVLEENETVLPGGPIGALSVGQTADVTLADSTTNIWGPAGPLPGGQTKYIGKAWCFGTLTPAPLTQDGFNNVISPANTTGGVICDGSAEGNQTQTDSLTADITFNAVQSRNNPGFICGARATPTPTPSASPSITPTPTATPTITPTPIACIKGYANSVVSSAQGLRKNGSAVLAARSNPTTALIAQTTGLAVDPAPVEGTFFSLGFGGNIIVGFNQPFTNVPGTDLTIYEVTGGVYPDELADVEVSASSIGPWTLIGNNVARDESLEMVLSSAQFVRITDQSPIGLFEPEADAFDLDGVQAECVQGP
jgi:hypothetical protein